MNEHDCPSFQRVQRHDWRVVPGQPTDNAKGDIVKVSVICADCEKPEVKTSLRHGYGRAGDDPKTWRPWVDA